MASESRQSNRQVDQAFRMETEGIGIIAPGHRHGTPRELFFVWFAAVLTFTGVVIGQLLTALGLDVVQALGVAVLCSISFAILGWVAASGPKAGTVTLTISRAAFGVRGNAVPALLSWLSAVGWEAVTMVLTVFALLSLSELAGGLREARPPPWPPWCSPSPSPTSCLCSGTPRWSPCSASWPMPWPSAASWCWRRCCRT